ncbi:MAG: WD40 repeat domain-containing protein, partial [Spirochaetota bacterium]
MGSRRHHTQRGDRPSGSNVFIIALLLLTSVALPGVAQDVAFDISPRAFVSDSARAADVEVSPFGTYVAVYDATEGNSIRLFDAELNPLWRYRMSAYWAGSWDAGSVVRFAPDETFVVFPGYRNDNDIAVVDVESGDALAVLNEHHEDSLVSALAISPDGSWLVSASPKELLLWRRQTSGPGFDLVDAIRDMGPVTNSLSFFPEEDRFAMSGTEGSTRSVAIYDVGDGNLNRTFTYELEDPNITHRIYHVAVSPDGEWLAAGYSDALLIFAVDGPKARLARRIPDIDLGAIYTAAFSPNGGTVVTGHVRYLRAWNLDGETWREGATVATQVQAPLDLAFTPDGRALYVASRGDENALAGFSTRGVGGSARGIILDMLGGNLSQAQKRVLTQSRARRILEQLGPAAVTPRDMFETAEEYEERISAARRQIAARVQELVEDAYVVEKIGDADDRYDVLVPVETQGTYDIDRRRYSLGVMSTEAELTMERDDARQLYLGWQRARLRATRFVLADAPDYADFRLAHPDIATEYPLVLEHNPFTGAPLDADRRVIPSVPLGPDLVLRDLQLEGIYPTLHGAYETEPIGRGTVANNGTGIVSDLEITFAVDGLTDTRVADAPRSLAAGQSAELVFAAPVSSVVLDRSEGRHAAFRVEARYRHGSESHQATVSRQLRVLNRNAIQWTDDRRVGAFMNVSDPEILRWTSRVLGPGGPPATPVFTRNLISGMRAFEALRLAGVTYTIDPNSAYEALSQDDFAIDYLRFPVEALAHGAGDCDDLSVLYATILESAGVRTAFITVPGHILMAFDSGLDPDSVDTLFTSTNSFILRGDTVWMPVETTLIAEGFLRAWQEGALQWRRGNQDGTAEFFTTSEAWEAYAPVSPGTDARPPEPALDAVARAMNTEIGALREAELEPLVAGLLGDPNTADSPFVHNRAGILYAAYGVVDKAGLHFERALAREEYVPALINQANVLSLRGEKERAREYLERARAQEPDNARVLLGIAYSYWESGNQDEARRAYQRVSALSPTLARRYPLFG